MTEHDITINRTAWGQVIRLANDDIDAAEGALKEAQRRRRAVIIEAYVYGHLTSEEIGDMLGITRQRVGQIIKGPKTPS